MASLGFLAKIASVLSDIVTPDASHINLSAFNGELVAKDSDDNVLYWPQSRQYTQQTTDATPTVPTGAYVAVAEGEIVLVKARIIARQSTLASGLGVEMWVIARRATGGNVTIIGTAQGTVQEDNGASPTVTLVADTVNQRINAQVTGVASETWSFLIDIVGLTY